MSDELEPCPWCGGEVASFQDSSHSTAWDIACFNEGCPVTPHVWAITEEKAIAAWNTRTDGIPSQDALIRAALEAVIEKTALMPTHIPANPRLAYHAALDAVESHIRALANDPQALAAIKAKAEGQV